MNQQKKTISFKALYYFTSTFILVMLLGCADSSTFSEEDGSSAAVEDLADFVLKYNELNLIKKERSKRYNERQMLLDSYMKEDPGFQTYIKGLKTKYPDMKIFDKKEAELPQYKEGLAESKVGSLELKSSQVQRDVNTPTKLKLKIDKRGIMEKAALEQIEDALEIQSIDESLTNIEPVFEDFLKEIGLEGEDATTFIESFTKKGMKRDQIIEMLLTYK